MSLMEYQMTQGRINEIYKESHRKETEILLRIDGIIKQLAMIRRVQEDCRLVCLDSVFDNTAHSNHLVVNSWAEQGRSKLKRLENEALMVRDSVSCFHNDCQHITARRS